MILVNNTGQWYLHIQEHHARIGAFTPFTKRRRRNTRSAPCFQNCTQLYKWWKNHHLHIVPGPNIFTRPNLFRATVNCASWRTCLTMMTRRRMIMPMIMAMRKDNGEEDWPSCHLRTRLSQGCTSRGAPIQPVLIKVTIIETCSYIWGVPIVFIIVIYSIFWPPSHLIGNLPQGLLDAVK